MFPSQTNTLPGFGTRVYNSGENLSAKEGRLVKVVDGGSIAELLLPTATSDVCLFLLVDGGVEDAPSQVLPLTPGEERRILANGAGSAGDVLILETIAGADIGKVKTIVGAAAGYYFSPGIAAEDFADEQLVKVNPLPRMAIVATQVTLQSTNGTAGAAADLAALKAETEKLGDDLRAMHAALVINGQLTA